MSSPNLSLKIMILFVSIILLALLTPNVNGTQTQFEPGPTHSHSSHSKDPSAVSSRSQPNSNSEKNTDIPPNVHTWANLVTSLASTSTGSSFELVVRLTQLVFGKPGGSRGTSVSPVSLSLNPKNNEIGKIEYSPDDSDDLKTKRVKAIQKGLLTLIDNAPSPAPISVPTKVVDGKARGWSIIKDFTDIEEEQFMGLRGAFSITLDDYRNSMSNDGMSPMSQTGGISGSTFLKSGDGKYILKSMMPTEKDFLIEILPNITEHFAKEPRSLIPRMYQMFSFHVNKNTEDVVVMNNVFPPNLKMDLIFDLKGAKNKEERTYQNVLGTTYKDCDFLWNFQEGIIMDDEIYDEIEELVGISQKFLEGEGIVDYSLLLGIHWVGLLDKDSVPRPPPKEPLQPGCYFDSLKKMVLCMGIIDILQPYTDKRKAEVVAKWAWRKLRRVVMRRSEVEAQGTIQDPMTYGTRFMDFNVGVVLRKKSNPKIIKTRITKCDES